MAQQYPAIEMDKANLDISVDIRAGAHSDYGVLPMTKSYSVPCNSLDPGSVTLLFQRSGQPGLEILIPSSSTWQAVPVYPPGTEADAFPPILVNIGDLLHVWTKGLFRSTVHRVIFPEGESEDRYSIAYFCHPLDHVEIEAVPSARISKRQEGKQQSAVKITAEGYLKKRLAETYGWGKQQAPERD